jgi:hypothetical protein
MLLGEFFTELPSFCGIRVFITPLHRPTTSLSCFLKSAYYAGIKIYNSLPSNITTLIDKQIQFKVALKRYLIIHSFYSVEEFMLSINSKGM